MDNELKKVLEELKENNMTFKVYKKGIEIARGLGLSQAMITKTAYRESAIAVELKPPFYGLDLLTFELTDFKLKYLLKGLDKFGPSKIFETGNSYHMYFLAKWRNCNMQEFLGHALLNFGVNPVVDSRWVAHRLIDGDMPLRVDGSVKPGQKELVFNEMFTNKYNQMLIDKSYDCIDGDDY